MFMAKLKNVAIDIETGELSLEPFEVAFTIAGYIPKKIRKKVCCTACNVADDSTNVAYFSSLSCCGLTIPSTCIAEFVSKNFAIWFPPRLHSTTAFFCLPVVVQFT